MRALAKANATAEIYVDVPKPQYFDRDELLDAPSGERRRPAPAGTAPRRGPLLLQATAIIPGRRSSAQ